MQAILDHLTAILVGATLLGAMLFIQLRQQQASIETVTRDRAAGQTSSFFDSIERETENTRTRDQSVARLGYYVMDVQGTDDRTDRFTFSTFEPVGPTGRVSSVSYVLVPTGQTIRVGRALRNAFNIERWTNRADATGVVPDTYTREGLVATNIVGFKVRAYDKDGDRVTWASTSAGYGRPGATSRDNDPVRFEIEVEGAAEGPRQLSGDQLATSELGLSRVSHSIRPVNSGATGSGTPLPSAPPARNVPLLPNEPTPPAPPPPTSTVPSPSPTPTPTPTPTPSPSPAPSPPPRPTPPAGVEV